MRTTSATSTIDYRCKKCGALLAKRDDNGLSIRRGDMQTIITGTDFTVAVTCYRCKTLNVVTSRHTGTGTGTGAAAPTHATQPAGQAT
jgi:phage FluMu protein Com